MKYTLKSLATYFRNGSERLKKTDCEIPEKRRTRKEIQLDINEMKIKEIINFKYLGYFFTK